MKKHINSIFLFLIPLFLSCGLVFAYFKIVRSISEIRLPNLPSISIADLIKLSRFSLEKAPSQSLVGKVSSMSGEVKYASRMATESAHISVAPDQVQQGESFSTGEGGSISIVFDQVVSVDIGSNSIVDIIQTLPKDLVFNQPYGTAIYSKTGNSPVSVRSKHLLVEDNGTIELSVSEQDPVVRLAVKSGSAIAAYNDASNISRVYSIDAGQTLVFNDSTRKMTLEKK